MWPPSNTFLCRLRSFQSTHPRRVWHVLFLVIVKRCRFQSTHPRRVWHNMVVIILFPICFNPHTHAGCDSDYMTSAASANKFQSTHPRRVWLCRKRYFVQSRKFQSTHPRRVWQYRRLLGDMNVQFQSTHPRRVWPWFSKIWVISHCFNPHTHAGCDHQNKVNLRMMRVSIHTPTQGVT